jgi:hypothetical protein
MRRCTSSLLRKKCSTRARDIEVQAVCCYSQQQSTIELLNGFAGGCERRRELRYDDLNAIGMSANT